ncbi:MAG: Imm1 family immunity protein [Actinomycetota bacterium]|nr:Imm1 family immunity protein [Actinomycetota bacterium]
MGFVLEVAYRHGLQARILRGVEDIDDFVAELTEAGWEYTAASVYAVEESSPEKPKHEMIIGADKTTGYGAVRYAGNSGDSSDNAGEWFSVGDHVNPDGVEFAYFGTGHDFPNNSEVSIAVVKQAMAELKDSGGRRPACVTWQVWA